eukprot:sb/3465251/
MVGILGKNSPEWHMTMQALVSASGIAVPLYLTLGEAAKEHILKETTPRIVICDSDMVGKLLTESHSSITTVITIGPCDVKLLLDDISNLRPTILPAVPRVLNKIYDTVNNKLLSSPSVMQKLFNYGVASKVSEVEAGVVKNDTVWDKVFFRKIQDKLGGRVKVVMSGSAPIQDHVIQWFRAVLGVNIIEGYGQTESTAATTIYLFGDTVPGHVGVPSPEFEVKLVDVPEMGYYTRDGTGEVCVRGPGVFKGYYKQPEKTAEVLVDGWLHSGDIGTWIEGGRLKLIDRKKNIFKLAQGEYIAPDKIELVYERCPAVLQVFVYGESLKASLIGLVVVSEDFIKEHPSLPQDTNSAELTNHILSELHSIGEEGKLNRLEQVRYNQYFHLSLFNHSIFSGKEDTTASGSR